jgi:hypothetical protein
MSGSYIPVKKCGTQKKGDTAMASQIQRGARSFML